jgi:hypothetical protein
LRKRKRCEEQIHSERSTQQPANEWSHDSMTNDPYSARIDEVRRAEKKKKTKMTADRARRRRGRSGR